MTAYMFDAPKINATDVCAIIESFEVWIVLSSLKFEICERELVVDVLFVEFHVKNSNWQLNSIQKRSKKEN
jgi:hypothetical protein